MTLNLFLIEAATEMLFKLECGFCVFIPCETGTWGIQRRTFILHNSNIIFWRKWCSGSHWRQFNWFGLSEFIWEWRLSINNQLDCVNIFFSKWHLVRRKINSLPPFLSAKAFTHVILFSTYKVSVQGELLVSPFGKKSALHRSIFHIRNVMSLGLNLHGRMKPLVCCLALKIKFLLFIHLEALKLWLSEGICLLCSLLIAVSS